MTSYRVSYSDDRAGTQVTSDQAIEMDLDSLLSLMARVLVSEGSFVNVEDAQGSVMTFMVDDESGRLLLDVPCTKDKGSYPKLTSFEECREALLSMRGTIERSKIEGLEFERW